MTRARHGTGGGGVAWRGRDLWRRAVLEGAGRGLAAAWRGRRSSHSRSRFESRHCSIPRTSLKSQIPPQHVPVSRSPPRDTEPGDPTTLSVPSGLGKTPLPVGLCSAHYGLALVLHISLFMAYMLRVSLSIAIVAMTNSSHPHSWSGSAPHSSYPGFAQEAPMYNWSAETQGIVLSSFFYGYGLTQALGGYCSGLFGGKLILGSGLLLSSVLTLLVPKAAELGVSFLIGLQVLLGLAEGVIFPAQYTLWAKWAPPLERSRLMNIADAGCTFGTFFALLVAGIICQNLGWPFVFYIFGGVGCAWCFCWFLLVYEDPAHHPWISAGEQEYIVLALAHQSSSHGLSLPLVAMAKSLPLWAITIACFCTDWLFYMLLTSMPTFMSNVLHFDLGENGLLSSLPYVGNGLGHILAGLLADFFLARRVLGTAAVRKLFSALGMLLPAIFLVAVPYIRCNSTVVVVLLTLALTIISMTGAGININHIDIAPRYAGFLLGITNTFGIVAGIIAPTAIGLLISQDLQTGWRNAFFISAALNMFGLVFYLAFGSGTIQDWAREDTAVQ
ncbi:sodium-dependent phosphate transport protein 3-like isoform X2 [Grus americana]|uniref:sodium-dependent phosphate transport protein 3-like isoform X2 n=1 Tax=Grus americana TaxID=9117 RepID=UPI00240834DC|nr:sodium-dependent phosphate transport protein 3-like isoform X2 [Grus americana]